MKSITIKRDDGAVITIEGKVTLDAIKSFLPIKQNIKQARIVRKKIKGRGRYAKISALPYRVRHYFNQLLKAGFPLETIVSKFVKRWGSQYRLPLDVSYYKAYASDARRFLPGRLDNLKGANYGHYTR